MDRDANNSDLSAFSGESAALRITTTLTSSVLKLCVNVKSSATVGVVNFCPSFAITAGSVSVG
jgi:hypothetical protein